MSVLDGNSFVVDDSPTGDGQDQEEPTPVDRPTQDPAPEPAPQEAQAKKVPVGRRGKAKGAEAELLAEIKSMREDFQKQGESYTEKLARIERENAELRGHFQGYMSQQQQYRQQEQARQDQGPDPDKLMQEANDALDRKDFAGYQKKYKEAVKADMMREIAPRLQQQPQQQAAPQINPMLQMVAGQYVDVVSDQAALTIAQAHDRILQAQGLPDGPDRWKRAFEEGRRYMGNKNGGTKPQFSQQSREVLSGVPTQRNGGGGARSEGPGVRLSALEEQMAKKFKMTRDEYAQHLAAMHPERVE